MFTLALGREGSRDHDYMLPWIQPQSSYPGTRTCYKSFIEHYRRCYINALPLGEDEGLGYGRVKCTHSTTVDTASIPLRWNENVIQPTSTNHPCYGEGKP